MKGFLSKFWFSQAGARDVLKIALPLIISTSAFTLQLFIDRMFLMWYSSQTISAAMYAGMLYFTFFSLLIGTASYVNTFVAQYDGAGQPKHVGSSIWQGIHFTIVVSFIMLAISFFSPQIIGLAGHSPELRNYETIYFRILCIGSMPELIAATLSCFYTGRGRTWPVMWAHAAATVVNIILDYALIFGHWHFPRWGIAGAAWATVAANSVAAVLLLFLMFRSKNRLNYNTLSGWRFDKKLFARLMRFGLPSGIQYMLDVLGFALFIALIGQINLVSFAATSIAFQINTLAFMPMVGFSTAVGTLVGQALGRDRPDLATKSTWAATYITLTYMVSISLGYIFLPDLFMYPFAAQADPVEYAAIKPVAINLLLFVAAYSLFDTGNLIFSAALKGAGDTRFVMVASLVLNWLLLVIPSYLAIKVIRGLRGLYLAWTALTIYVSALAILFFLRFMAGKWKTMRVIEAVPPKVAPRMPAVPTFETESN